MLLHDVVVGCDGMLTVEHDDLALARDCTAFEVLVSGQRPQQAGVLALAVGVDAGSAVDLVPALVESGAVGLVVSRASLDDELRRAAEAASLVLIAFEDSRGWWPLLSRLALLDELAFELDARGGTDDGEWALHDLAVELGHRLGNPITIETTRGEVLAYSEQEPDVDEYRRDTVLRGAMPQAVLRRLQRSGALHRIDAAPGAVLFPAPELSEATRAGVAIRVEGRVEGYIWILQTGRAIEPADLEVLTAAARRCATHLTRLRLRQKLAGRRRDKALGELLQAPGERSPAAIARLAADLGLGHSANLAVIVATIHEDEPRRDHPLHLDVVASAIGTASEPLVVGNTSDAIVAIVATPSDLPAIGTSVHRALSRARPGAAVAVGISEDPTDAHGLAAAYAHATRAAFVATLQGLTPVQTQASSGTYRLLAWLPDGFPVRSVAPGLDRLRRHDDESGADLVATLDAYLDAALNGRQAARLLHIHHNTLAYRLRRITEVADLDFSDPEQRLAAQVQLRWDRLRGAGVRDETGREI